jgi:nitrite reductase/ring-hydroxylating ferredoxin subunit
MARYLVAKESDIPVDGRKLVTVKGRPIAIFNVGGEYLGVTNRCPHQGASLCHGTLIGEVESTRPGSFQYSRPNEILRCPWHGWEFDLRTGRSKCRPNKVRVKQYDVGVSAFDEDAVTIETFDVTTDGNYLFIEM